jgi:hypothetical protein
MATQLGEHIKKGVKAMGTMLEKYLVHKANFIKGMQISIPGPIDVWRQQELLYRIEVLEACQMFMNTAPHSAEPSALIWHYQMVDAYIQNLTMERRFGNAANEQLQQQRETAHKNLSHIIQDYRTRFGSFNSKGDADFYKEVISKIITTILPVWIQYRQTFIEIQKEAA